MSIRNVFEIIKLFPSNRGSTTSLLRKTGKISTSRQNTNEFGVLKGSLKLRTQYISYKKDVHVVNVMKRMWRQKIKAIRSDLAQWLINSLSSFIHPFTRVATAPYTGKSSGRHAQKFIRQHRRHIKTLNGRRVVAILSSLSHTCTSRNKEWPLVLVFSS